MTISQVDMKLTVVGYSVAALVFGVGLASADGGSRMIDGAPVLLRTLQQHIHGQAVTVQLLAVDLHMMNHRGFQPVGLWEYFYILPDASTGNASICEQWFNQVLSDESSRTAASSTLAWLEVHVSEDAGPTMSDEGNPITPDSAISCWEAIEFRQLNKN